MVAVAGACARASAFAPRVSRVSAESSGRRVFSSTPHVSRVGASRSSLGSRPSARVRAASESSDTLESVVITAEALTPEAFAPFGQVISAEEDGAEFGPDDAQLDLSQGTPRFYIMRLRDKAMRFDRITYHGKVTQCLGALGDHSWYMAVAAPTMSVERRPSEGDIHVFEIPGNVRQDARRHVARGTLCGTPSTKVPRTSTFTTSSSATRTWWITTRTSTPRRRESSSKSPRALADAAMKPGRNTRGKAREGRRKREQRE